MIRTMTPPVVSAGNTLIVFDDNSRLRWTRSGLAGWQLAPVWPEPHEREAIMEHIQRDGCVLVIVSEREIVTNAWRSEVPFATPGNDDGELLEIRAERFDWLPESVRRQGQRFLAEERARWARDPAVLRPALTLSDEIDVADRRVRFAMTAPAVARSWLEREIVLFLQFDNEKAVNH
jgi:hypothetical protein